MRKQNPTFHVAELPPKTEISYTDMRRLNRACDDFFKRRGLYVEPILARYARKKREAQASGEK